MLTKAIVICLIAVTLVSAVHKYCNSKFKLVSAGCGHALAVLKDGTLIGWGSNDNKELGPPLSNKYNKYARVVIKEGKNWKQIVAGCWTSYALEEDGTLWSFGSNSEGQLGANTADFSSSTPLKVGKPSEWEMIAAGSVHVVAIKKDGSLWIWGSNTQKQLGVGIVGKESTVPIQILPGQKFKYVSAGSHFSVAIRDDDTLWGWGKNSGKQLGSAPEDGEIVLTPKQIAPSMKWKSVSCGQEMIMAIAKDGSLFGWGKGILGNGGESDQVQTKPVLIGNAKWASVSVFMYGSSILGLQENGDLYTWGNNEYGQLGNGGNEDVLEPKLMGSHKWEQVSIGSKISSGIAKDGTLYSWGYNELFQAGFCLSGVKPFTVNSPSVCGSGVCGPLTGKCRGDCISEFAKMAYLKATLPEEEAKEIRFLTRIVKKKF